MTFYVDINNITALQFEIPLVDEINIPKYSGANFKEAFFNLPDGSEYPCGNNDGLSITSLGTPKCYIFNGDNTNMGMPTSITIYDINYSNNRIVARILLHNPDVIDSWMSVRVKAYKGKTT